MLRKRYLSQKINVNDAYKNLPNKKKTYIENFIVTHPLFDKLMETKINKCLQHGNIRNKGIDSNPKIFKQNANHNKQLVQAPCINGASKSIAIRPKTTNKLTMHMRTTAMANRPKTTNTVIRSRTSEPRIHRKLQFLSKQQQMQEEDLKPSFMINFNRRRKSNFQESNVWNRAEFK